MKVDSSAVPGLGSTPVESGLSRVGAISGLRPTDAVKPNLDGAAQFQSMPAVADPASLREKLEEATESLTQHFQNQLQSNLQFAVDDESGELVVRLVDADNGDVLRQIPSEDALKLARNLREGSVQLLEERA